MSERVYVVRLTEEQHKQCFHGKQNSGAHYQLPDFLWSVLESVRSERPERQALLEELAALALLVSYTANDPNDEGQRRFREAAKRFRSLEGK